MQATAVTTTPDVHRTRFGKVRWTVDEYAELVQRAEKLGLTVSSYIRHAALGKQIIPLVDLMWIAELRRIGGLLKHHYPQIKSSPNWTAHEKQKYWETRNELLKFADQVTRKVMGKKINGNLKSGVPL